MVELEEMPKEEVISSPPLPEEEELLLKTDETNGLETRIQVISNGHDDNENEIQKPFFKKNSPAAVDVQWENISYSVSMGWRKEKKMIIKQHFGKVRSGEMAAILGSSGAGKTTLLKILAGYTHRNITGRVALNGQSKMHRRLSCYIMQEEIDVLPYLTVREIIEVAARLKIRSQRTTYHGEIVSEVIEVLGLTECQNTRSKDISGGQRKRLSIAQELVSNPPVLFLDEPTSGLDSTTCINLVRLLKQLSNKGHTIICTIHQPSSFVLELFDKLYVMSKGECVYQDSVSALLPFLESQGLQCPQYNNPVDYMLEIMAGFYGNYHEQFKGIVNSKLINKGSTEEIKTVERKGSLHDDKAFNPFKVRTFSVNPLIQFYIILSRTYKSTLRNPFSTHIRLAAHIVIPLILGTMYWQVGDDASMILRNTAFIFIQHLLCVYSSVVPPALTFPNEMPIFLREHMNNWYSPVTYYVAKTVADIPLQVLCAAISSSILYWMTGQPPDLFRFGLWVLIFILVALVAQSFGLVVGATTTSIEMALFKVAFITTTIIILSNYGLKLSTVPSYIRWTTDLSYYRYALQATSKVIYGFDRPELHCPDLKQCYVTDPELYLEFMGVRNTNVWYDILVLVGFVVFVRVIGYGIIKWKIYFRK